MVASEIVSEFVKGFFVPMDKHVQRENKQIKDNEKRAEKTQYEHLI